jgi:hypothetical protein
MSLNKFYEINSKLVDLKKRNEAITDYTVTDIHPVLESGFANSYFLVLKGRINAKDLLELYNSMFDKVRLQCDFVVLNSKFKQPEPEPVLKREEENYVDIECNIEQTQAPAVELPDELFRPEPILVEPGEWTTVQQEIQPEILIL